MKKFAALLLICAFAAPAFATDASMPMDKKHEQMQHKKPMHKAPMHKAPMHKAPMHKKAASE